MFLPDILPLAIPRSSHFSKCRVITLPLEHFTRSLTSVCLLHSFIPAFVPFVYYACCKNSFMPPRYLPPLFQDSSRRCSPALFYLAKQYRLRQNVPALGATLPRLPEICYNFRGCPEFLLFVCNSMRMCCE